MNDTSKVAKALFSPVRPRFRSFSFGLLFALSKDLNCVRYIPYVNERFDSTWEWQGQNTFGTILGIENFAFYYTYICATLWRWGWHQWRLRFSFSVFVRCHCFTSLNCNIWHDDVLILRQGNGWFLWKCNFLTRHVFFFQTFPAAVGKQWFRNLGRKTWTIPFL